MKYLEKDLVRIAKRENNAMRNYLVVDPLQGKHIPVSPSEALELFSELSETFKDVYEKERLLLVGFAETATAIGAQAAISAGTKYIQTTREIIPDVEYLFFSEEHSHATEQKLVKNDIDRIVPEIDRIIFIEDEVTTGNTILNIIKVLEKTYSKQLKFAVASLLNGMSDKCLNDYKERNIKLHYLVKTDHALYPALSDQYKGDGKYYSCIEKKVTDVNTISFSGWMNARRLIDANEYRSVCGKLWENINKIIGDFSSEKVLVVGTEEFMYPALYIGKKMEEAGNDVRCHSTTRSPIIVSMEQEYPLQSRYELKSLYDKERKTFLYDIGKYDRVFVVTDAQGSETEGISTLVSALNMYNENITIIRWCENA